ncbi:hypothetical protein UFOVP699_11 [uncultured Caudovirales phage]|uniref:Uncharacterized protein n=1 Tax=uncultured Caudovirales phage TaxID=2100421 RepID=A0A6J5NGS3_9CAUD|nr:hypothetical protein UFOVP699_11 [uncultured Caudovirales phage]
MNAVIPVTGSDVEKILKFLLNVKEFFCGSINSLTVVLTMKKESYLVYLFYFFELNSYPIHSKINNKNNLYFLKKNQVLDPLWITKGSFLDPEYFNYILLDANQKYKKDLEEGDLRYFYELFFHSLNLNNLAVDGKIFDFKMHPNLKNERIDQIKKDLKHIFERKTEVVEIFRNANYVFLNLILDYMDQQMGVLDEIEFFYLNHHLHEQKEIYLVITTEGTKKYSVWSLKEDRKKDFGYSFKKVKSIIIDEIKENALREKIEELGIEELLKMKDSVNVCFAITEGLDEKLVANVIKDLILLNKGIAKELKFEPTIISELQTMLMMERIMPFTLTNWI